MLFNFANNTISLCFFCFFLINDLYILILVVITQFFFLAEFVIPIRMTTEEAKAKMEVHPVTEEAKIRECSI